MSHNTDLSITFRITNEGLFELRVASREGYDVELDEFVGPEELLAVADLIDQFKPTGTGRRKVKEMVRNTIRTQITRAEHDLEVAKRTAESIPKRERKLQELRKVLVS